MLILVYSIFNSIYQSILSISVYLIFLYSNCISLYSIFSPLIVFSEGLCVINVFTFENVFILISLLKLLRLATKLFFDSLTPTLPLNFKILWHCLLASIIINEKSLSISHIYFYCKAILFFYR